MKFAIAIALSCLTLTSIASTIEGKVVRVADGDTITILDEAMTQAEKDVREMKVGLWKNDKPIEPYIRQKQKCKQALDRDYNSQNISNLYINGGE